MSGKKRGVVKSIYSKTAKVLVTRFVKHQKYEKGIRLRKVYTVHDQEERCKIGDEVVIEQSSPISKTKRWKICS